MMNKKEALKLAGFRDDYDPNNRIVKQDTIDYKGKRYFVSTVDLGLNHQFYDGPPLYYETMIFLDGTWRDLYCDRYSTRESAIENHNNIIQTIKDGRMKLVDGYFEFI